MSAATTVILESGDAPATNLSKLRDTAAKRLVEARRTRENHENLVQIYASAEAGLQDLVDKYDAAIAAISDTHTPEIPDATAKGEA